MKEPGEYAGENCCRDGGLTLIELLVVIATISVLIAVLIPSLGQARRSANRVKCRANLKQIAQAWQMYLMDYNGRFLQRGNAHINYGGWVGRHPANVSYERPLNPYLHLPPRPESPSAAKIYRCPSDTGPENGLGTPYYETRGTSYQTNFLLIGPGLVCEMPSIELSEKLGLQVANLTLGQVNRPSLLLLVGDYGWNNCWQPSPTPRIGTWHGQRCGHCVAFLDGHAGYHRIRKGLFITDQYTVLPSASLYRLARRVQVEEECVSEE